MRETSPNILITGGGGSVGRVLIRRFLYSSPGAIRVFDKHEPGLTGPEYEFNNYNRSRSPAGDIQD
jgi:FlaA1/EpsC-like NDP-sugar epimerase